MEIGILSAKYESGGDPGAVGFDSGGGWSYGMNQIATKTGTFALFLAFCQKNYPAIAKALLDAGGTADATTGTQKFKDVWKQLAKDNATFEHAQHDFIVESQYGMAIRRLRLAKIDLEHRTGTLANVIYSMAVMAGPGAVKPNGAGACGLIFDAICALGGVTQVNQIDDAPLIDKIYEKKLERIDTGREYKAVGDSIRKSVRKRVVNEHSDAVALLAKERAAPVQS